MSGGPLTHADENTRECHEEIGRSVYGSEPKAALPHGRASERSRARKQAVLFVFRKPLILQGRGCIFVRTQFRRESPIAQLCRN